MHALPSLCSLRIHSTVNTATDSPDTSAGGGKRYLTEDQTNPPSKKQKAVPDYVVRAYKESTKLLADHLGDVNGSSSAIEIVQDINDYLASNDDNEDNFEVTTDGRVIGLPKIFGRTGVGADVIERFLKQFREYTTDYKKRATEQADQDKTNQYQMTEEGKANANKMFGESKKNDTKIKDNSIEQLDYFNSKIPSSSRNRTNPRPAIIVSRGDSVYHDPATFRGEVPNSCCAKKS